MHDSMERYLWHINMTNEENKVYNIYSYRKVR